jgi:hypothetical protein
MFDVRAARDQIRRTPKQAEDTDCAEKRGGGF